MCHETQNPAAHRPERSRVCFLGLLPSALPLWVQQQGNVKVQADERPERTDRAVDSGGGESGPGVAEI